MKPFRWLLLLTCLCFVACDGNWIENSTDGQSVLAWVPIYAKPSELQAIAVTGAQPTVKAGKIYAYGNYIFQNDQNKGIHIIDNSIPSQAKKLAFINIPFSTELAIKGRYLYTNSVSDLLVFDLADLQAPKLLKRVKDAFPVVLQDHPPFSYVYFECPDPSKGIVVDWQEKMIPVPNCRR